MLTEKIDLICKDVKATEPPTIYITNSEWVEQFYKQRSKVTGESVVPYKEVFRYEVAKTKPYKGNRKNPKPFHFYNIIAHFADCYDLVISEEGLEADDMMCIAQNENTIICSRDKDLRICPGWHYSWECGKQRSIGPVQTNEWGWLEEFNGKIIGYGLCFFYFQMLVGDIADNVPGLPKWGEAKAYKLYKDSLSCQEFFKAVKQAYKDSPHIDNAKEYFLEQANLLWMVQEKGKGFEL